VPLPGRGQWLAKAERPVVMVLRKPPSQSALPGPEKHKTLLTTEGSQAGEITAAERRSGTERELKWENRELLSATLSHEEANCPSRQELEPQQSSANRKAELGFS